MVIWAVVLMLLKLAAIVAFSVVGPEKVWRVNVPVVVPAGTVTVAGTET